MKIQWNEENIQVIIDVLQGNLSKERGALKLGVSTRTIINRANRFAIEGEASFVHKNTGQIPSNKKDISIVHNFIEKFKLDGCNFSYLAVLLKEETGFSISSDCIRKRFYQEGILSSLCRRKTRRRLQRELKKLEQQNNNKNTKLSKMQQVLLNSFEEEELAGKWSHPTKPRSKFFGERIEMDASLHFFVPGYGKLTVHTAIDDASGHILGLWIEEQETLHGYYQVMKQVLENYGIPSEIRTDRRSIFIYNKLLDKSPEKDSMTQFAYAMSKLGVSLKCNSDPGYKPKCERLNHTLQNQIIHSLKVKKIKTIAEANEHLQKVYIPRFNKSYGYANDIKNGRVVKIGSVFHKVTQKQIDETLVWLSERVVNKGNSISYEKNYYALFDERGKILLPTKTKLTIAKTLTGELFAVNEKTDKCYCLEQIKHRYEYSKEFEDAPKTPKKKYKPPQHHPWSYTMQMRFKEKNPEMQELATAYR